MLLNLPSDSLSVFSSSLLELLITVVLFVFLIQTTEETSLTRTSRTIVRTSTCTLFLHSVHGICNVERLFESADTRRSSLAVARTDRRE
jgi:hypothetical protein